jgi:hypothetical protein
LNESLEPPKHLANRSALVHVSALLSALNALAARFAVLAVPIAAIPRKAQTLLFLWILNSAHTAALPPSAEYATFASCSKMKVAYCRAGRCHAGKLLNELN